MRSNLSSQLSRLTIALLAAASVWGAQAQTYELKQWVVDLKPTYSTTARWEPQTVNMGSVLLHQTAQQSVTLFNDGNAAANFSSLSGTGSGISVDAAQCAAVAAGSSCAVTLTFSPLVDGAYSLTGIKPVATGSMPLLTANALSVSGVGVHGIVSASPTSLTFSPQQTLSSSAAQAVTLTNTGSAPLTFNAPNGISVDTGGSDFNQSNSCASLAIGGTCTVSVLFRPTAIGPRSGSVLLADDGGGVTHLMLSGTGQAPSVTLSSPVYASTSVGSSSTAVSTLTNTGLATIGVTLPTSASVSGSDFSFSSTTCLTTLAATAQCTVTTRFAPTAATARLGSLSFATEAGTVSATLGATGTAVTVFPANFVSSGGKTWSFPYGPANYASSNAYCATAISGVTGWRMPSRAELASLYADKAQAGYTAKGWPVSATAQPYGLMRGYEIDASAGPGTYRYGYRLGIGGAVSQPDSNAVYEGYVTCVR